MPDFAYIRDAFDRDKVASVPVVKLHKASFDVLYCDHVFRIHDAYAPDRIYSAAVAVPVK